ncbi:lipase [Occultella glacieicola]|uniref:Lipase n=1 Tax=Occultella glacieicola TaxID=2518684 RepID=A0ABY2E9I1_9MICO|nr:lipase [Occultella glacieicola]
MRALPWVTARAPWWVAAVLGVILVAAGLVLVSHPLGALGVLGFYVGASCVVSGVADLLGRGPAALRTGGVDSAEPAGATSARSLSDRLLPWFWIAVGVVVIVWLGRDVGLFGPAIAIAMIVSGCVSVLRPIVGRTWRGAPEAMLGIAEVTFGVLALLWPDATLIVIAVLFGARTVLFGLTLLIRAGQQVWRPGHRPELRDRRTAVLRWVGAAAVLALAVGAGWISHTLRAGIPVADSFFDTPGELPDTPGHLIRWEEYSGNLPDGMVGFRIFYTTTNAWGEVVPSSGMLAVPADADGPVPLITWAHGTVGVARACAPSIGPDALTVGGQPAAAQLADLGWAMVASDYPGMGAAGDDPYLIGEGEGRAVLDAARAARQLETTSLSDQTVIWGHSQGGHGALWAGQLADDYAPDLNVLGTAALSPASNPRALADSVLAHPDAAGATLGIAFVVDSYTRYYPDLALDDTVVPAGRTIVREAASRCTGEGGTLVTILAGLSVARDQPIVDPDALAGTFGDRLTENTATGPWAAPVFIGQGEADEVIEFGINTDYVGLLCGQGVDVEFHGYPDGTHMSVLATGSQLNADVVRWTQERLAGSPSEPNCP